MEHYKHELKRNLIFGIICVLIAIGAVTCYIILYSKNKADDFSRGFQLGVIVGLVLLSIYMVVDTIVQMKNEKYRRKEYIKKNDDREKLIIYKTMLLSARIFYYVSLVAMFISLYFSKTVFITLIVTTLAFVYTGLIIKIIYKRIL